MHNYVCTLGGKVGRGMGKDCGRGLSEHMHVCKFANVICEI